MQWVGIDLGMGVYVNKDDVNVYMFIYWIQ